MFESADNNQNIVFKTLDMETIELENVHLSILTVGDVKKLIKAEGHFDPEIELGIYFAGRLLDDNLCAV